MRALSLPPTIPDTDYLTHYRGSSNAVSARLGGLDALRRGVERLLGLLAALRDVLQRRLHRRPEPPHLGQARHQQPGLDVLRGRRDQRVGRASLGELLV